MGTLVFLVILAVLALFMEAVFFALPLLLVSIIVLSVLIKETFVYVLAFTLGLLFDSMTLQTLGTTSLFLLSVLFLVSLYERKFETRNVPFVLLISTIATVSYLLVFGSYIFFIQLAISLFVAFILFFIFDKFVPVTK